MSAPIPTPLGELTALPDPLAGLGEGEGIRREGNWERKERKGKVGEGREREGKGRRVEERGKGRGGTTKFQEKLTPPPLVVGEL